jgi:hypothetical protein
MSEQCEYVGQLFRDGRPASQPFPMRRNGFRFESGPLPFSTDGPCQLQIRIIDGPLLAHAPLDTIIVVGDSINLALSPDP